MARPRRNNLPSRVFHNTNFPRYCCHEPADGQGGYPGYRPPREGSIEPLAIIAGSAFGGVARFWLADAVGRALGDRFPWGTLAVNASGAFAIGVFAAVALGAGPGGTPASPWPLAVLAFLGSYTTVSSFSLQTLALVHDRAWRGALANVVLSLGLCLSAAAAGLQAGGLFVRVVP